MSFEEIFFFNKKNGKFESVSVYPCPRFLGRSMQTSAHCTELKTFGFMSSSAAGFSYALAIMGQYVCDSF